MVGLGYRVIDDDGELFEDCIPTLRKALAIAKRRAASIEMATHVLKNVASVFLTEPRPIKVTIHEKQ